MIPTAFRASKPVLRFPEFSENWQLKKGGELFHNRREKGEAGIEIYSVTMHDGLVPRSSLERHMHNDAKLDANFVAHPGDIAYNMMRMWQGAMGLADTKCMISPAYIVLKPKHNVNSVFYLYLLKSYKAIHYLWAYSYGLTSDRLRLYFKDFSVIPFPYTSYPEQQKIADFLTSIDLKIQQLELKKALMQKYKKGIMQKLFSRQIRFKNGDGEDCCEWENKHLQDVVNFSSGSTADQNSKGIGVRVSRIETISDGSINSTKVGFVNSSIISKKHKLSEGDILFSNINSVSQIGKSAIFDGKIELYHGMNLLRLVVIENEVNADFIYYLITSFPMKKHFMRVCNRAVNQASINQTELGKTKIKVPSMIEQQEIARFLKTIDSKIKQLSAQVTKAEEFKKSVLQQMFV